MAEKELGRVLIILNSNVETKKSQLSSKYESKTRRVYYKEY